MFLLCEPAIYLSNFFTVFTPQFFCLSGSDFPQIQHVSETLLGSCSLRADDN